MCALPIEDVVGGITVTRAASGVRLSTAAAVPGVGVMRDLLTALELSTPGDTQLRAEPDTILATRFLADPTPAEVHEASATLAKTVAHAREILTALAKRAPRPIDVPEPRFPDPPGLGRLADRIVTVRTPIPAWRQPDPAEAPIAELAPGCWFEVVDRIGDWAKLRGEDGLLAYADARVLIPVGGGPPGVEGGNDDTDRRPAPL